MFSPLRWGIAGAGRISYDFCNALDSLNKAEHQIVAIASREKDRAEKYAKEFNVPTAYGSYEELAKCQDVDIVYVGTLHITHYKLCKMMLEAGHHVLCEKSMCMNYRDASHIIHISKTMKRFFMEGHWSRFFPAYDKLREHLAEPMETSLLGEVRSVEATFGIPAILQPTNTERYMNSSLGGGALLDLGCYCIQFATLVFNEKPVKITATGRLHESGSDAYGVVTLEYSRGRMASLTYHTGVLMSNSAHVYGTKGSIELPMFWKPTNLCIRGVKNETLEFPLPKGTGREVLHPKSEGFVYEAEKVRESLLQGSIECSLMSHTHSLLNMEIIDKVKSSVGLCYPADLL